MESEQYNYQVKEPQENSLKDVLTKYLYHWKWFVLSLAVSMFLGFVYLRYQVPVYEASASILIRDDKKGGSISETSAFEDLGILKSNKNIDNEIEILKSRSLMSKVVKELKLNITYYSYGRPIEHERYSDTPILISCEIKDTLNEAEGSWLVVPESDKKFLLKNGSNEETLGTYAFGESISTPFGKIIFATTSFFSENYLNKNFRVIISPVDAVVNGYLGAIKISHVSNTSNAITISLRDAIAAKAVDVVDNLIKQHNQDALADKNEVSQNTSKFINDRISFITGELSVVEGEAENFKTKYKLTDVDSEAKLFIQSGSESEMSLLEVNTQMRVAEFMDAYLQKHGQPGDLIPTNLGLSEPALSYQIGDYNKLVLERNRILKNSSGKNPAVENLNDQLDNLKGAIRENLNNLKATLQIRVKELAKKEGEINSKIGSVPKYEREYRIIQRQQQIKEALYLYLLQKREETNIALAVTVANAKIIDKAYSNGGMVAPKRKTIHLVSFLIGLILPILVLYLLDLLDTKVHSKKDIDKLNIPFLGDIPLTYSKEKMVIATNDNSNIAEAFRLLRTNIDFITSHKKNGNRTVFVTSTLGKEGKSFIALNLAASFALSGKRTLLIGTDLRAPKILEYLHLSERNGLTNYITQGLLLNDIIFKVPNQENLDILSSGPIPPNPAELLLSNRIRELFEQLKPAYDYIIVDTAPVGLVTDTLLISAYADSTVFVTRANYLDKRLLRIAETLNKEKRLPNMAILINGSDLKKGYGYGYGYGGYGYGNEKQKGVWKRLLRL